MLPKFTLNSNFQQILLSKNHVLGTLLGAGVTEMNNMKSLYK